MKRIRQLNLGDQKIDGYNYYKLIRIKRKSFKLVFLTSFLTFLGAFACSFSSSIYLLLALAVTLVGVSFLLYEGKLDKFLFLFFLKKRTYI